MTFNDVGQQYQLLKSDIDTAIAGVLQAGQYILGPQLRAFEQEFATYCGAKHGIGVASGMDALTIGLQACGVGTGDEVLVPAVSAAATAMAVVIAGARPVFVDVSPSDFTMDPACALERVTTRTRAVLPVHLYGMPARIDQLAAMGFPVIEDAAQAHGVQLSGMVAAFSFYPTKNLGGYGDGGMLVTSSPEVADRAGLLRNYGQRHNYASEIVGHNSRLDEIQAAVLRVKLRRLDEWNTRRREIAALYHAGLWDVVQIQAGTGVSTHHLFVVVCRGRDALREHLAVDGIPTLVHYPLPLHRQMAFWASGRPAPCPNAVRLCDSVLSLPMHAHLTDADVERVIDSVRRFFR